MKKILRLFFAVLFFLACSLPIILMPFFGEDESLEKRELSSMPSFITEDKGLNMNFTKEFETYIGEHFAFRSELVTAFSLLKAKIFATSSQEKVIVGKDDWLYFAETLDDYTGKNILEDSEINKIKTVLDLIDENSKDNERKFLFMVAPNKNTVYPGNMPYYHKSGKSPSNLDKLDDVLKDSTYYLPLLSKLKSSDTVLYHKRDSHWNNRGAFIAYSEICSKLGRDSVNYEAEGGHYENSWSGDLDGMIFPKAGFLDEQFIYNRKQEFYYTSSFKTDEDINIKTLNPDGEGKLHMFRDSFGNALYPFLASDFNTATFTRVQPYRINLIAPDCDTVVIEIVERNIKNLLNSAPVMQAPEREVSDNYVVLDAEIRTEYNGSMLQVYGATKQNITDDIYLKIDTPLGCKYYEAFPVLEYELLKDDPILGEKIVESKSLNGFSAYIPIGEDIKYNIEVITKGD